MVAPGQVPVAARTSAKRNQQHDDGEREAQQETGAVCWNRHIFSSLPLTRRSAAEVVEHDVLAFHTQVVEHLDDRPFITGGPHM